VLGAVHCRLISLDPGDPTTDSPVGCPGSSDRVVAVAMADVDELVELDEMTWKLYTVLEVRFVIEMDVAEVVNGDTVTALVHPVAP